MAEAIFQAIEKKKNAPGRLCIFFGCHPLGAQTDAMIAEALKLQASGQTVFGCISEQYTETYPHKKADCFDWSSAFNPGCIQSGIDVDDILRKEPDLFFTNEPAHRNAPESRHHHRYQELEELLRAGIDVSVALDVVCIESLRDVVFSVLMTEPSTCVPDSFFDGADSVIFVDTEPFDLLQRINDRAVDLNVPVPDAPTIQVLRELALRRAANRLAKINREAPGLTVHSSVGEHILICLSASPSNARVIRTAARMADAYHAALTAIYVQPPDAQALAESDALRLSENRRLAEQLGARIETVYGDDIAAQISEYANTAGISRIVLGRSNNFKSGFALKPDLIDRLTRMAPHLDIYIIPDSRPPYRAAHVQKQKDILSFSDAGKGLLFLFAATLLGLIFDRLNIGEANIIAVYLLAVVMISVAASNRMVSVAASGLSVVLFNFFFTAPRYTLQAYDAGYSVTFAVMLIVTVVVSTLTTRIKAQARQAAQTAYRTQVLLETSQQLQTAEDRHQILHKLALQLQKLLDRPVVVYPVSENRLETPFVLPRHRNIKDLCNDGEREAALWVGINGKHAGAGTDTLPDTTCLYMAVRSGNTVHAVAGIALEDFAPLEAFEKNLLVAMLDESALALDKDRLNAVKNSALVQAKQEQLRANLLRAISHDLRTPLTSISGNASILQSDSAIMDETKKQRIYADIYNDAMWLFNLVENLLSITRFDGTPLRINLNLELLDDVIAEAVAQITRRSPGYSIRVDLKDDLLMAYMDARLILLVLLNILNNAVKYTPPGSHIVISGYQEGDMAIIEIADDGPGISEAIKPRLFDMFFTDSKGLSDSRRGLGLGLALCKSIVTAHDGTIWIKDNLPKGSVFGFSLRAKEELIHG